jgi:ABC-type transport system substrate-binding protein
MGKSFRDQMTALELGKADLVEVAPEQLHRVSPNGHQLTSSRSAELVALLFAHDAASPDEKTLREALALSVDRGSIRSVLLEGTGQPAASILPNWMSGYGFVFPTDRDLPRARRDCEQIKAAVHSLPTWSLGYDASDPLARILAERIALNAKDAGLSVQPIMANATDMRLVHIPLTSPDPWVTLADLAAKTEASMARTIGSVEELYTDEQALLATERLIPLFHLPASYAAVSSLNDFELRPDGSWNLTNAWLGSGNP